MIVSAVVLLLSAGLASAFQAADSGQVRKLKRLLDDANRLQLQIDDLRGKIRKERRRIDPDSKRFALLYAQLGTLMAANTQAHVKAIDLAIEAYGLAPAETRAVNRDRDGPFGGIPVKWTIGFRDSVFEYRMTGTDGKPRSESLDTKDFFGIAFADGTVILSPRAFRSSAFLAAVVVHERAHYDQATAPDGPNGHRPDFEMRELYARQAVLARRELLGLSQEEIKRLDEDLSARHRRLNNAPWSLGLRSAFADHREDREARLGGMVVDWAAQCGMTWIQAKDRLPRFSHQKLGRREHLELRHKDADGARAALLLASACLNPEARAPCLDGMDGLDLNWEDPAFRDSLPLAEGSQLSVAWCVNYLVEHYRPGGGFDSVRETIAAYRQTLKNQAEVERQDYLRRQREASRAEWERQQDKEQEARDRFIDRQMRSKDQPPEDKVWSAELQRWIVHAR